MQKDKKPDTSVPDTKKDIALYDLSQLKAVAQGNQQFVDKMVGIFLEQAPLSIKEIQNAYKAQEFDKIKKVAHKIKPMIDMMGVVTLKKEVRLLEKDTHNLHNSKELDTLITYFTDVLNKVTKSLNCKSTTLAPDSL